MNQPHPSLPGYRQEVTLVHRWQQKERFDSFESCHTDWLVFVVEDGSFYYRIGEEEGTASFGDLVFCPPQTVFRRVVVSPVTLFVIFFNWRSLEEEPDRISVQPAPSPKGLPSGKISLRHTARLVSTLELMQEAYRLDHVWKTRRLAHYADDLWLQYCGEQEDTPASFHEGAPDREDGLVREAAARITAGAFSPMRLQDVAAALGISLSSLTKRFKKHTGSTPIQYMTRLRMEKAKTLLLETGLTVDQISECCGYQNGFYLSRVFIRHFGIPPAQFRSRHKI